MTPDTQDPIHDDRLWHDGRWTLRAIKSQDDDCWARAMFLDGQAETALVGLWTMGRDKKNHKALDVNAFYAEIRTSRGVIKYWPDVGAAPGSSPLCAFSVREEETAP